MGGQYHGARGCAGPGRGGSECSLRCGDPSPEGARSALAPACTSRRTSCGGPTASFGGGAACAARRLARWAWPQPGILHDAGHDLLAGDRHDVDAMNAGHRSELLDQLDTDPDPSLSGIGRGLYPLHQFIGDPQAGYAFAHAMCHRDGLDGQDTGKDMYSLVKALSLHLFHPTAEARQVEDSLSLNEISARTNLLAKA